MAAPLFSPYFLKVPISNIAGFYVDISSSCSRPRGSKRGCTVIHKYPEQINSKGFLPSAAWRPLFTNFSFCLNGV